MQDKFRLDRRSVIFIGSIAFAIFAFVTLLSFNIIGYSVEDKCQTAQEKYGGDCVEALTAFLDDANNTFRSRNSAIWALGQLGDRRALPVLQGYRSAEGERSGPLDRGISQYELEKAIRLIDGGFNATAFFWR